MPIFCGIDPGFSGGISIISEKGVFVFKMPVIKESKKVSGKTKTKQFYDLRKIREILLEYTNSNAIILLERVSPHPGEGSVSSFSFGRGVGDLEGIIVGLFDKIPREISPVTWKKHFPVLTTEDMLEKKAQIKLIKEKSKTLKDKAQKKANNKEIDSLNRQIKASAKDAARNLAKELHPELSGLFKFKNSDGVAESLLIALYGKDHENELV